MRVIFPTMDNKLDAWQKKNGVTNKALSVLVGVHASLITHIKKRSRVPSAQLALRIEKVTKKAVPFRTWYPDDKNAA